MGTSTKNDAAIHVGVAQLNPHQPGRMASIAKFGPDVQAGPAKSYISLLRGDKKFGIVQVSTERTDIGIKLKGVAPTERFEAAGT